MKRKDYQSPTMIVVNLQHRSHILSASIRTTIEGNGVDNGVNLQEMEDDEDLSDY